MILAKGRLWPRERQEEILSHLEAYINRVRATKTLSPEVVIRAADRLGARIEAGEFDRRIAEIASPEDAARYKAMAVAAMRRENTEARLRRELGKPENDPASPIRTEYRPLGTLFHIPAGNMDGLPALSAAEGLLTGNFNLLKLPSADSGLTVEILSALIEEEPELADWIAVFDTPSTDTETMLRLAQMADGIVFWGGGEAGAAVRALAPPGVKLIEWGHRLGFAYVSGFRDRAAELSALADSIAASKQLLCSSCQVIYLDTARLDELEAFGREFLPFLEEAARRHPELDPGILARLSVGRRCRELSRIVGDPEPAGQVRLGGKDCSVTVCRDSSLELSPLYGNVLLKRLPEAKLLPVLRAAKGTLQTAGLICAPEKRERLTDALIRAGVNRVTAAGHMNEAFPGESHDGEYPLRRYVRAVNIEKVIE